MPEVDLSRAEAPGATILLIEDDAETAVIVEAYLISAGLGVVVVTDGLEGPSAALALTPDAIVLDRSLPGMEGLVLLGRLRVAGISTPAMVLSARASVRDRIEGLEAGADDYLVKPFALDELLARLRVMLRRAAPSAGLLQLVAGPLVLNLLSREVRRNDVAVPLQPKEVRLLEELMRHAGTFVPRSLLLERVWNFQFDPNTKIVETHMSRLRAKLNAIGPDLIETRRAHGYRILP